MYIYCIFEAEDMSVSLNWGFSIGLRLLVDVASQETEGARVRVPHHVDR